jgi:hypothetical protein
MTRSEAYATLADAYLAGDSAEILAAEYTYLLAVLTPLTEWRARTPVSEGEPTILERMASLLPDQLPEGPAPSLSDSLHALDIAFAGWQAENEAWQRWQARQLAAFTTTIEVLYAPVGE